ncbi:unnamed protein product [Ostreobium quekettii]|uniref:Heme O synthase n=1 Tax=Ostreobium quekettii TaxID=121088 RepID=A0A8S1IUS8_9CHLO|nr:unnamed protein product [Ostreobium quekettii]
MLSYAALAGLCALRAGSRPPGLSPLSRWPPWIPGSVPPGLQLIPRARSAVTIAGVARRANGGGVVMIARRLLDEYKRLSKAKLSALVTATACTGYVLGSGETVDWAGLGWTALGTMGAAACANALNQIAEVRSDGMMARTASRPLPSGRMAAGHALCFAVAAGAAGIVILGWKTNALTAGLGAANIALYAGAYTALKRVTPWNTWVGAVVGAIPPLMGWAAASGTLDSGAWVLAAALYFWQIPHFLALAWLCREDYARAGYKMLSKYDPTGRRLGQCALRNSLYLLPLGVAAAWLGVTSQPFVYESAALSVGMGVTAAAFCEAPSKLLARAMFKSSLVALPLFMAGMLAHRVPNEGRSDWRVLRHRATGGLYPLPVTASGAALPERDGSWECNLRAVQAAPFPFAPLPLIEDVGGEEWEAESKGEGEGR